MARDRATDTQTLVSGAAEVFREKGYRNTTIDDIAEAVGISRPTVYKYVESKRALLDLMVERLAAELDTGLGEFFNSEADAKARLTRFIGANIRAAVENHTLYAIVFSEMTELSEEALARFTGWAHDVTVDFRKLIDECRSEASLTGTVDTWIAANLILSMFTSLYRWYDPSGSVTPEQLADQVTQLLTGVIPADT